MPSDSDSGLVSESEKSSENTITESIERVYTATRPVTYMSILAIALGNLMDLINIDGYILALVAVWAILHMIKSDT